MKVNVRVVITIKDYLAKINREKLENINFYDNYEVEMLDVSQKELDDWNLTGLNNVDFIMQKWNKDNGQSSTL